MHISLITPSRNSELTIGRAIQSVIDSSESHPPFSPSNIDLDYHIVDASSSDNTTDIIRAYSSLLTSWSSEPDSGMYAGLNKGFQRSRGTIMGWINSDDFLLPGALQTVAEIFQSFPTIQWITSLTQLAADCEGRICIVKKLPGICSQAIRDGAFLPGIVRNAYGHIQQESTFWRRSLWDSCGGSLSEQHGLAGDYELWQRFSRVAEPVGLTVPLGVFRLRAGQASSGIRYLDDLRTVWNQQRLAWPPDPGSRFRAYVRGWNVSDDHHRWSRLLHRGTPAIQYAGQRLVRLHSHGSVSGWRLEPYTFL